MGRKILVFILALIILTLHFSTRQIYASCSWRTCEGDPDCDPGHVSGCTAASFYCDGGGCCHVSWNCNCDCGWGEWRACNDGWTTRYCTCNSALYQISSCTSEYCGDGICQEGCDVCVADCGYCCSPSCSSPYCGQGDGCGGTCSSSSIGAGCGSPYCGQLDACGYSCGSGDAGAPAAPALSPADGGTVTVSEGALATVSWSAPALADSYYLELYPAGTNCLTSGAYCASLAGLSYSFLPLYPGYYYRVRALNSSCATEWGGVGSRNFLRPGRDLRNSQTG